MLPLLQRAQAQLLKRPVKSLATGTYNINNLARRAIIQNSNIRCYHSEEHLNPDDVKNLKQSGLKEQILSLAVKDTVRNYNFSKVAVDASKEQLLESNDFAHKFVNKSTNLDVLFNNNEAQELIEFYLDASRIALQDAIKSEKFAGLSTEADRLKFLIKNRIMYNIEHLSNNEHDNRKLQQNLRTLLSTLVQPSNVPSSVSHLYKLADDFLYYAGDDSHSFDWYEKRLKIGAIFVKSELFMINDQSKDFNKTLRFVDEQVEIYQSVNNVVASVQEWMLFNGFSLINLIKSQLARG